MFVQVRFPKLSFQQQSDGDEWLADLRSHVSLESLQLHRRTKFTVGGLRHLVKLRSLRFLSLRVGYPPFGGMSILTQLHALQHLQIQLWSDRRTDLAPLYRLPHLQSLVLSIDSSHLDVDHFLELHPLRRLCLRYDFQEPDTITFLRNQVALEQLTLQFPVSDQNLRPIRRFTSLRHLELDGGFGDDGLVHLCALRSLVNLVINSGTVTDNGLVHLYKLTALENLELRCCRITGSGFAHLVNLHALRRLILIDFTSTEDGYRRGFRHLGRLPSLDRLELLGSTSGCIVAHLAPLRTLRYLSIRMAGSLEHKFTDIGLTRLADQKLNLQYLTLRNVRDVTDQGLTQLIRFQSLRYLCVTWLSILRTDRKLTHEWLAVLRHIPSLRHLNLTGFIIGEELDHLGELPFLVRLDLGCSRVMTTSIVQTVCSRLPSLRFLYFYVHSAFRDQRLAHLDFHHLRQTFPNLEIEIKPC